MTTNPKDAAPGTALVVARRTYHALHGYPPAAGEAEPDQPVKLMRLVELYPLYRDVKPASIYQLRAAVMRFATWRGSPPTVDDFRDATVNALLAHLEFDRKRKRETVRSTRRCIITLWRFADELELINHLPRRVKLLKREQRLVQAWTVDEMEQILAAVDQFRGYVNRHPTLKRRSLWRAILLLGFNTALRPGDLFAARWTDVRGDVLLVAQQKTGGVIAFELWPETIRAMTKIRDKSGYLVGGRIGMHCLQNQFGRFLKWNKLPGSLKWMRKTAATIAEMNQRGSAKHILGHRTDGLAERHYIDARVAALRPIRQPRPGADDQYAPVHHPSSELVPTRAGGNPWGTVDVNTWTPDGQGGGA